MDAVYTYANDGHACSDPVSIELYSKEKLSADVKAKLSSNITSKLPKPEGNKTLIIGAKVGATI